MEKEIQKYWYKTVILTCPVCLFGREYRYRVYGEKPKKVSDRVVRRDLLHYCDQ